MKTIKIKLDDRSIEVSKLAIGRYTELLKALKEIPKKIVGMGKVTADQILEALPTLLGESLPEAINVLTIATPLTSEELNQLGLDEIVRLCLGVYEVNNYKDVYEQVKKATAQPKTTQ